MQKKNTKKKKKEQEFSSKMTFILDLLSSFLGVQLSMHVSPCFFFPSKFWWDVCKSNVQLKIKLFIISF